MDEIKDEALGHSDIRFFLSECARFQQILDNLKPGELKTKISPRDAFATLSDRTGRTAYICGADALSRFHSLSENLLKQSDANGSLDGETVFRALSSEVIERFLTQRHSASSDEMETAIAAAMVTAKAVRKSKIHFIPCRLMYAKDPDSFQIGPVTFKTYARFQGDIAKSRDGYLALCAQEDRAEIGASLMADAEKYYSDFSWVAEVNVSPCDKETSRSRATQAVTSAINFLHLLFGSSGTKRLSIAGPMLDRNQRSHLSLDSEGNLEVVCSSGATSAVGFPEGWSAFFEREEVTPLLVGIQKAMCPIVNPSLNWPVSNRLLDAVGWFGESVRETSAATAIVKAVMAIERLLVTDEKGMVKRRFSRRGAAFACCLEQPKSYQTIEGELKLLYELRSAIVHGSVSPFDPEITAEASKAIRHAEHILRAALSVFESYGLLDKDKSNSDLAIGFDQLVATTEKIFSQNASEGEVHAA